VISAFSITVGGRRLSAGFPVSKAASSQGAARTAVSSAGRTTGKTAAKAQRNGSMAAKAAAGKASSTG